MSVSLRFVDDPDQTSEYVEVTRPNGTTFRISQAQLFERVDESTANEERLRMPHFVRNLESFMREKDSKNCCICQATERTLNVALAICACVTATGILLGCCCPPPSVFCYLGMSLAIGGGACTYEALNRIVILEQKKEGKNEFSPN